MASTNSSVRLVVLALPEEASGLFVAPQVDVIFTGVGKVNASHHLTRALAVRRAAGRLPEVVLNFGTAGSARHATGSLLSCTRFVQRDMDVRGLGFDLGVTPFESIPHVLAVPNLFPELLEATCASADRFETLSTPGEAALPYDALDMEAYALAKVCHFEQVPFACVKYISDGADHNASSDWHTSLPLAAEAFWRLYQQASTAA